MNEKRRKNIYAHTYTYTHKHIQRKWNATQTLKRIIKGSYTMINHDQVGFILEMQGLF